MRCKPLWRFHPKTPHAGLNEVDNLSAIYQDELKCFSQQPTVLCNCLMLFTVWSHVSKARVFSSLLTMSTCSFQVNIKRPDLNRGIAVGLKPLTDRDSAGKPPRWPSEPEVPKWLHGLFLIPFYVEAAISGNPYGCSMRISAVRRLQATFASTSKSVLRRKQAKAWWSPLSCNFVTSDFWHKKEPNC